MLPFHGRPVHVLEGGELEFLSDYPRFYIYIYSSKAMSGFHKSKFVISKLERVHVSIVETESYMESHKIYNYKSRWAFHLGNVPLYHAHEIWHALWFNYIYGLSHLMQIQPQSSEVVLFPVTPKPHHVYSSKLADRNTLVNWISLRMGSLIFFRWSN